MAIPLIGMAARSLAGGGGRAMAGQAIGQAAGQGLGQAVDSALHPLGAMTAAINKIAAAAFAAEAPFKALEAAFRHVGSYVGKFSPIRMEFFERAVADFEASIGKILVPILNVGTQAFRKLGDMVVTMMPAWSSHMGKIADAIGELITQLVDLFLAYQKTVTNGEYFITMLVNVIRMFAELARIFQAMIENNPVSMFKRILRGESALMEPGSRTTGSARGMAYQQTTTESVTSMMGRLQQDAFGYSGGPAEKTAENTGGLLEYFTKGKFAQDVAEGIKEVLAGGIGEAGSAGIEKVFGITMGKDAGQMMGEQSRSFASDPLNFLRQAIVPGLPIV